MNEFTSNLNHLWAKLMIDELVRCGVTQFCVAPGSRSTPLVAAAAQNDRARIRVHGDERGVAFFALGYGRATGRPAAVITTSGTAVANLLPAVVESSLDNVPMILLTADRPPELRDCGANQTIRQVGIFSSYPRWQFDLPCPDTSIDPAFVLSTVDQAYFRAVNVPAGPVHLNCMYREPLAPDGSEVVIDLARWSALARWVTSNEPFTRYHPASQVIDLAELAALDGRFSQAKRPLLVVGELRTERERTAVAQLADRLGWPVLADITSGLRSRTNAVVAGSDLLLADPEFRARIAPDGCLQIGGRITSSRLTTLLAEADLKEYALVSNHPGRYDPQHRVSTRVVADVGEFCRQFAAVIRNNALPEWRAHWQSGSQKLQAIIDTILDKDSLSEPSACRTLSRMLQADHGLFLASSMPIRYMDMYAAPEGRLQKVQSNRGASGIDGTIASATGYATGLARPVTLLIGDQAFLHDLNSLLLLRSSPQPVIIVLLNNDGGRIFEHLPIARHAKLLDDYFVASHGLKFDKAAAQFGIPCYAPVSIPSFCDAYAAARQSGQSALIELVVDAETTRRQHRDIQQAVTAMLRRE